MLKLSFYGEKTNGSLRDFLKSKNIQNNNIQNLKIINCGINIIDIDLSELFPNLIKLNLSQNNISKIERLENLIYLQKLDLSYNQISDEYFNNNTVFLPFSLITFGYNSYSAHCCGCDHHYLNKNMDLGKIRTKQLQNAIKENIRLQAENKKLNEALYDPDSKFIQELAKNWKNEIK